MCFKFLLYSIRLESRLLIHKVKIIFKPAWRLTCFYICKS